MKKGTPSKYTPALALVLILAAVLAVAGVTAAIYTSQAFQRGVVRNQDTKSIFFSSDKLYRVAAGTDAQTYYYPMSSKEQNTMTFQVCNYDQSQNTAFSEQDIGYSIRFQVTDGTDAFVYTISSADGEQTVANGGSVSFDGSLLGGKRSANAYTFTFGPEDYNKVQLEVTVTPNNPADTRNTILNGILIPIAYASTQGITVKSEFTDSIRGTPDQFDAYNLSVSISGGASDVLITWDHTQLDIDPFFRGTRSVTSNGNFSTITVPMSSEDETGAYLIQFYSHNSIKPTWTSWSELPISVKLNASSETP